MVRFSRAYAFHKNLYAAKQQAPSLISTADNAGFLSRIAEGYALTKDQNKEWQKFKDNKLIFYRRFLPYINENQ
jgi:hypothetical protein